MLKALKSQLLELSADPLDPFAALVVEKAGAQGGPRTVGSLRNMIVALPEILLQVRGWLDEARLPARIRRLHAFLLAYLYNPTDFLPEGFSVGLFGYLDDAYFASRVYEKTMLAQDYTRRRYLRNLRHLASLVPEWTRLAGQVIPEECARIDLMIDEIEMGRVEAFDRSTDGDRLEGR